MPYCADFLNFAVEIAELIFLIVKTFQELGVCDEILRAISEMGFVNPMPIQEEVIPYLLGVGNDVIALAQTGTGKTAAFGIPLLQKIDPTDPNTQAVVVCPTRELCLQITDDMNEYSKYLQGIHIAPVYGGTSINVQIKQLRKGAQIIVATPGRLIDLMNRGAANLEHVRSVVLDEADEMLNMGFQESIDAILAGVPEGRNTLLFSATMSREIEKIAKTYLNDYKEIVVGSRNEGAEHVNHIFYLVNAKDKYLALKRIVDFYPKIYAIIFCRTKIETQEIADKLIRDGYNAESLHGDLSQDQRDLTMQKFRQHLTQLLVATDVAARGLDVDDLTHVINYGLPDDIENYIHRSGRTGRAGKNGTSIAIIHTRERGKIKLIERELGKTFTDGVLPTPKEICTKQLFKAMDQILKSDVDEEQIAPFMDEINRHFEFIDKDFLIKKIVSMTFGRFLSYYAHAPEIEKPVIERGKKSDGEKKSKGNRTPEAGYARLFINLGKTDGFYPGEVMQFINRHVPGKQRVGQIDLFSKFSYIEVPINDAKRVMRALDGTMYKNREVRCNAADSTPEERNSTRKSSKREEKNPKRESRAPRRGRGRAGAEERDWRKLMQGQPFKLKGETPDFSEDGWAMRKPRKKKK